MSDSPHLFWFREDLRLNDNPALHAAATSGKPLICVYVLENQSMDDWPIGGARKWWLHHSLAALTERLKQVGGELLIKRGSAATIIPNLVAETGAEHVYWTRRYAPHHIQTDTQLKQTLEDSGVSVTSMNGRLLFEPWQFKTGSGTPYRVFTPFWKAMQARGSVRDTTPPIKRIESAQHQVKSTALNSLNLLPTSPNWAAQFDQTWHPGEAGAKARLVSFIETASSNYITHRDRPAINGTSLLSPHLQHGEISPVQIWHAIQAAVSNGDIPENQASKFLSEIAWREFSYGLLFANPDMLAQPIMPSFNAFPWRDSAQDLAAWQTGQTGYPIVDAGMRQLWQTGWMHNRVRMIVASFLVKHLMIDWRKGMAWFWDTLVDADIASNTASWQWVAGCGADAAPYFRIFNPMTQAKKFDPQGEYIRRYVPELAKLPDENLYAPWETSASTLNSIGLVLGRDYPAPIVDHRFARERALAAYAEIKK